MLRHIDAVKAAGIEAIYVAPDHWRHVTAETGRPQAEARAGDYVSGTYQRRLTLATVHWP